MIDPGTEADEAWYANDDGTFSRSIPTWKRWELEDCWTPYIARFGRRWLLLVSRESVTTQVIEFQTKEAAILAWRIMR